MSKETNERNGSKYKKPEDRDRKRVDRRNCRVETEEKEWTKEERLE